jgi:raffinose/stachyose/melibiose transport system substrate-binding protein
MKKTGNVLLCLAVAVCSLAGCSKKTASSGTGTEKIISPSSAEDPKLSKKIKILSIWPEDNDNGVLLTDIFDAYKKENPNFDYDYELVSSSDLRQKVTTLAASNDLPDIFVYESGKPILDLVSADKIMDTGSILEQFNCSDKLSPSAVSLLKNLSGTDKLYDLPLGLNIEGFWYNKALFKKAHVDVPETWNDFEQVLSKLKAAGIQPLAAGGSDKWGVTRLINAYLVRTAGADAMKKAAADPARYTDAPYVAAAKKIQDWAKAGYFGIGVTTVDMNTAGSMLLTGKAAIFYNGSWFASNLNDKSANAAGEDGIGFFNIPVVDPSISSGREYSMNCGNILCIGKNRYDEATGWLLKYFVEHIGDTAMSLQGSVKGYTYTVQNTQMSDYTKLVLQELGNAQSAFTWFEATMGSEVSTVAQNNVQTLLTGDMSAMDYMKSIQYAVKTSN